MTRMTHGVSAVKPGSLGEKARVNPAGVVYRARWGSSESALHACVTRVIRRPKFRPSDESRRSAPPCRATCEAQMLSAAAAPPLQCTEA
jgi:hypothetical protein